MPGISYKEEHWESGKALAASARMQFGAWLSLPEWDWYTTHTFRAEHVSQGAANYHWYSWWNSLCMAARAKELPRPFYFRCEERQERGTLHYHALVGGVGDIRRLLFKDFWELNGFARVEKYEPGRGANFYVGKYLNKADGDIRWSHNLVEALDKGRIKE